MKKRALLAIAFAGGLLNSQLPALSDNDKLESADSIIRGIAKNEKLSPEDRAFNLLRLASLYLEGGDKIAAEAQFRSIADGTFKIHSSRMGGNPLVPWAEQLSLQVSSASKGAKQRADVVASRNSTKSENVVLADAAMHKALKQLDVATNKFARTNLYFIASLLFQKAGNENDARKCNEILEKTFQTSEKSSVDEEEIKAALSVLNSMAYEIIPVRIPDSQYRQTCPASVTKEELEECLKVKLRAAKIADQLPPTDHERRKAHRDLALWCTLFEKTEMAEQQKQILFELVGFKDDAVLYPQAGACGHFVWWKREKFVANIDCGMG